MGREDLVVKKYGVRLSTEERAQLEAMLRRGKHTAQHLTKARICLKADVSEAGEGWSDNEILEALATRVSLVYRARTQLVEEGFEAVLTRKQRVYGPIKPLFDGEKDAQRIALWCGKPPAGHAHWSLRLLEKKVVERPMVDTASDRTIGRGRKKTSPAAFVAAMADMLAVDTRPRAPSDPLVCVEEATKQLTKATRAPIPMKRGRVQQIDSAYARNGTAKLCMMFAPLDGWRPVKVPDRHPAIADAQAFKDLADRHFPHAKKIMLVQDNLPTQTPASLYEAFPPEEARRLVERFAWHCTPTHGSWLDRAESERSVLSSQCLDRRIPDKHTLKAEVAAWEAERNTTNTPADWQFTTDDARMKLQHLYSSI
jgi:hypothetical protein